VTEAKGHYALAVVKLNLRRGERTVVKQCARRPAAAAGGLYLRHEGRKQRQEEERASFSLRHRGSSSREQQRQHCSEVRGRILRGSPASGKPHRGAARIVALRHVAKSKEQRLNSRRRRTSATGSVAVRRPQLHHNHIVGRASAAAAHKGYRTAPTCRHGASTLSLPPGDGAV